MRKLCLDYLKEPTDEGWEKLTSEERRWIGRQGGKVPKGKPAAPAVVSPPKSGRK